MPETTGIQFDKPRGVNDVEVREGFAKVLVEADPASLMKGRILILEKVHKAGISIDFLKFTQHGVGFVVSEDKVEGLQKVLDEEGFKHDIQRDRCIFLAFAENMRDEEGLMAEIISTAIQSGAAIGHMGDMHDRLLIVTDREGSGRLEAEFAKSVMKEPAQPGPNSLPNIKVLKFGGTSLKTPEARDSAAKKVSAAVKQGFLPVVVVSAMGRRGDPYATDTLISLIRDMDLSTKPEARELDLIMGVGEVISSVVFAHLLKTLGHRAKAVRGGQAGIYTDPEHGSARITRIDPSFLVDQLREGVIPVVCGFQGVQEGSAHPGHEMTTLGRGGSDTTASALGAALRAEAVEIYTDVDGVKTADPDFVRHAPTLRKVAYAELAEIAHLGAKVVHPRAAEIAMKNGIPLWVKKTTSEDPGTEIVAQLDEGQRAVTGVAHTGKLVSLQMDLSEVAKDDRKEFQRAMYGLLRKYQFNLYMINVSPTGLGWAVPRDQFPTFVDLMDGLVLPLGKGTNYVIQVGSTASKGAETQIELMDRLGGSVVVPIEVNEGCTMVSLVGKKTVDQPGVFHHVLSSLQEESIAVIQTTDSESSLSVLISESQLERAVSLLHALFVDRVQEA